MKKTIWTIGHSTRDLDLFIDMLKDFKIEKLVDVRSFPGSKRHPQFNKESLETNLPEQHIDYEHLKVLGGRRKTSKDSKNTTWRLAAFRGYADYMETKDFKKGIEILEQAALKQKLVYMCAEAVWWSCHRSMISDFLKARGWKVMHIMDRNKAEEHPYTQPARINSKGELTYRPKERQAGLFE